MKRINTAKGPVAAEEMDLLIRQNPFRYFSNE